jgi:hypothetical protein
LGGELLERGAGVAVDALDQQLDGRLPLARRPGKVRQGRGRADLGNL